MRLGSRYNGSRDGELVVVSRDLERYLPAGDCASTLQAALDDWKGVAPALLSLQSELDRQRSGHALDMRELMAPLPRAYEWLDGSSYVRHIELSRKARRAELPSSLYEEPLMYQGGAGGFLAPRADVVLADVSWGLDFEAEIAVVVDDVAQGTAASAALAHIKLVMLANDWTLRDLVPAELEKGFGFVQSKPATAFAPLALTPDELWPNFRDGRVHLPLISTLNGRVVGRPNAGAEMHFSFAELIAHAAKTRSLVAGSIVGSGTVSSAEPGAGVSCLVEQRMLEILAQGAASTRYLQPGDTVRIEMLDEGAQSLFGAIEQKVVAPSDAHPGPVA